jgi:hypothetical protein
MYGDRESLMPAGMMAGMQSASLPSADKTSGP